MVDFDSVKNKAQGLRGKAEDYIDEHRDQIDEKLDKAGDFIGDKTGKGGQADKAVDKVKGFLDRSEATDGKPDDAGSGTPA